MVFHWRLHSARKQNFKASHLRYASKIRNQCQATVKLLGSFRLATGKARLHAYCIFTEQLLETVPQSLSLSCGPELHVLSIISNGIDYIFILYDSRIFLLRQRIRLYTILDPFKSRHIMAVSTLPS